MKKTALERLTKALAAAREGVRRIENERTRQIVEEGFTAAHDEEHSNGGCLLRRTGAYFRQASPYRIRRGFHRGLGLN